MEILGEDDYYMMDHDTTRMRIFVNKQRKVVRPPELG